LKSELHNLRHKSHTYHRISKTLCRLKYELILLESKTIQHQQVFYLLR